MSEGVYREYREVNEWVGKANNLYRFHILLYMSYSKELLRSLVNWNFRSGSMFNFTGIAKILSGLGFEQYL